jgi:hypothetical protein
VEESALAFSGLGLKSAKGQLFLWLPSPALLVAKLTGQGDKGFAAPIVRGLESSLARGGKIEMFFDAESMATYDSELRTALTAAFLEKRGRISGLHVLVGSKLTAMGVSVANVALGGIVITHSERPPFARALDRALAAAGVTGFSSETLAGARDR